MFSSGGKCFVPGVMAHRTAKQSGMGSPLGVAGREHTLSLLPGLAIAVPVLGFNLLGDGLSDLLDPRGGNR